MIPLEAIGNGPCDENDSSGIARVDLPEKRRLFLKFSRLEGTRYVILELKPGRKGWHESCTWTRAEVEEKAQDDAKRKKEDLSLTKRI